MRQLKEENLQERERQDNITCEFIDQLKDKSKEELARIIEAGMQHKVDLTVVVGNYQIAKQEKERHTREIH
jgi:hypothetical protein